MTNRNAVIDIIVSVTTERDNIRSEIVGWSVEKIALFVPDKPIGMTKSPQGYHYKTIFEYLTYGFKLLGPPTHIGDVWDWWLVREKA
jgi:hypothetical protein